MTVVEERLARSVRELAEVADAKRSDPARWGRVRAACVGSAMTDTDVHAARIVNTVNRLEAPR